LHGEAASNFPPKVIDRLGPQYDWRALQRWKIDEKLLPSGSTILYRTPTLWEQHRALIIGAITIGALQALLIAGLLFNLIRRRRAESSLGESEKRFQAVADATPVLIWMTGEDQGCTFFNKAWLEFTGRSMEQELGRGWRESVHPDDRDKATESYGNVFKARQPFTTQYRMKRSDGEYRWLTDHGVPRYGPRGNFRGYVGACVDITDLLKKDAALRESEERIALAAEAAQVGVWELDIETNEVWFSDKARSLFEFDNEVLTYEEFQARVHPEDRSTRDAAIRKSIVPNGHYELEYRILLRDGTVRWISGRGRCLPDDKGKLCRLLGVAVDVTKRRQAEELFRLATEASPSGIVLVDERGRIILVNAHIEELFGYKREELINRQVDVLVPDRSWSAHPGLRQGFLADPFAREVTTGWEILAQRKDGTEFPVEVGLNPIDAPQGLLVLANVVDISARKAAEVEARQRREQVELLSRASLLGEMTASLAHELNQPLSAITSNANAGMLFIEKGNVDISQLHEIFHDVVADGRRAHEIVQNVRSAIKKGSALRGRINVNQIVETVAHMVQPDASAHSCTVEMALAKDLPAVDGDPSQLQQALINLVSNAFQAMRETPAAQRKVHISTTHNGNGMVFVGVRDYGHGIAEAARGHLFEQFFTTKQDGLGMGLAIVRSIVEAHGGRIEAENVAGGGAHFRFHLPSVAEGA
jgi:PAS domain S-box-containing protein